MEQINLTYVTSKKIEAVENGEVKPLTVLVLDVEANTKYWKIINSFGQFIEQLGLKDPSEAVAWHISEPFAQTDAFQDILNTPGFSTVNDEEVELYKIAVSLTPHDKEFCVIELKDGKLVENTLWK